MGVQVTRSGFVALAGRPNVGKSTLVNALVGEKVAIVSDRPQTTRRAIRGVRSAGGCQMVLVDLPGVQRPRDALTERMAQRVRQELEGCDAALMVLNGEQGVGPGDRFIAQALVGASAPVTIAVNKADRLTRAQTLDVLERAVALGVSEEVFPISARTGVGVEALTEHLTAAMPEGPFMFGEDASSDQPQAVLLAELIREAAIKRTFKEVPHAAWRRVVNSSASWVFRCTSIYRCEFVATGAATKGCSTAWASPECLACLRSASRDVRRSVRQRAD
jgi:GTPase